MYSKWPSVKGDFIETYNAEKIIELGKMWHPTLIGYFDSKEVLSRYEPEERVAGLKPEEVMQYYKPKERLAGLKPEEPFAGMSIEDVRAYLEREEQKNSLNGH